MLDPFWWSLLAKMVASACVVVVASALVERSGPLIGALIATLPLSAGPNFVYLALEHGPAFLAQAARVGVTVNLGTAPFIIVYAHLAQRQGLLLSLAGGYAVWAVTIALALPADLGLAPALALNVLIYGAAMLATRRFAATRAAVPALRRWWDWPLRAAAVMGLVAGVVLAGRMLGAAAAGIVAMVPMVMTSLIVILHTRIGGPATAAVLVSGLPGMVGFVTAIAVLSLLAIPLGSTAALTMGLAVSLIWNLALLFHSRRLTPARAR